MKERRHRQCRPDELEPDESPAMVVHGDETEHHGADEVEHIEPSIAAVELSRLQARERNEHETAPVTDMS